MKRTIVLTALLVTAGPAAAQELNDAAKMMQSLGGGLSGKKLRAAIAEAEVKPLGSRDNPVRVDMPVGERAYLQRLRCADGSAPAFERAGSVGTGPYGYTLDLYSVTCAGMAPVEVYMDMYHHNDERRPLPGFGLAEAVPAAA